MVYIWWLQLFIYRCVAHSVHFPRVGRQLTPCKDIYQPPVSIILPNIIHCFSILGVSQSFWSNSHSLVNFGWHYLFGSAALTPEPSRKFSGIWWNPETHTHTNSAMVYVKKRWTHIWEKRKSNVEKEMRLLFVVGLGVELFLRAEEWPMGLGHGDLPRHPVLLFTKLQKHKCNMLLLKSRC